MNSRYLVRSILTLAMAGFASAAMAGHPGHPAPPPPNASTTVTFSDNPAVLTGDSDPDVVIDTLTTSTTLSSAVIDEGKVTLQMAVDTLGRVHIKD